MSLATLVLVSAAIALASTSSSSKEEPFDSGELPIFHSDKCTYNIGVNNDFRHLAVLEKAEVLRREADKILWDYFQTVQAAYAEELSLCDNAKDWDFLRISKSGIDDVIKNWNPPC